jgi:SAM-dependent methyltransferase
LLYLLTRKFVPTIMGRDVKQDWREYIPVKIPSKGKLPGYLYEVLEKEGVKKILDLGCGTGKFAIDLFKRGYSVMGVDINEKAIEVAKLEAAKLFPNEYQCRLRFIVGDATDLRIDGTLFDAVLLQLVISIIGNAEDREKLIQVASAILKSGGILYFSASGVSDEINPKYAALYQKDLPLTGEEYTYFSRDQKTGEILYLTHHFTQWELEELLKRDFEIKIIKKEREVSSRRPNEAACFFYVIAKRKGRQ